MQSRVVVSKRWGGKNDEMLVKMYKLQVIRRINSGDLIYTMVTKGNNTVLYT